MIMGNTTQVIAEDNNISQPHTKAEFDLAIKVSDRVNLQQVLLLNCNCVQDQHVSGAPLGFVINKTAEATMDADSNRVLVVTKFDLNAFDADNKKREPFAIIQASFLLVYSAESLEDITQENIDKFAELNGIYNSWPYWREFVQNTIARMNLPPLTIPVFRLFPPKKKQVEAKPAEGTALQEKPSQAE